MMKKIHFICMGAENLGVESLISILRKNGFEVSLSYDPAYFADLNSVDFPQLYRFLSRENQIIEEVKRTDPDIVGLSSMTDNFLWNINIATKIKTALPHIKVLFGGIHPTIVPEYVIKYDCIDYVLMGEAEYTIIELLKSDNNIESLKKINGLWFKDKDNNIHSPEFSPKVIHNLDELPFIDKDLFYSTGYVQKDVYRTMASRGCPYNCSYCCYDYLHKLYKFNRIRFRKVEIVIEELKCAKRRFNPRVVHFNDDIFTYDRKWLTNFLSLYRREINLPYSCIIHPKFMDKESARMLKESGCYRVQIGIQSLNNEIKRKYFNRFETTEDISRCFDALEGENISFSADYIIGVGNQRLEDILNEARFYYKYKNLKMLNVYWLTFYPKTGIIEKVLDYEGRLKDKENIEKELANGKTVMYLSAYKNPNYKDSEELKRIETALLLTGSLNKRVAKFILEQHIDKIHLIPYSARYLLYLFSILSIPDHSWISYMKTYIKGIPSVLYKNLISQIIPEKK